MACYRDSFTFTFTGNPARNQMAVFANRFRVDLVFFFFYAEDGGDIFL
jgi:hypothetical protein